MESSPRPDPRREPTDISPLDPLGPSSPASLREALSGFPVHRPPDTLFRFSSARGINALTEGLLKITPPIEFNDPFEVWAGLSTDALTSESVLRSAFAPNGLYRAARLANYPGYDLAKYDAELAAAIKDTPEIYRLFFKSIVDAVARSCAEQYGVTCFSGFSQAEFQGELGIHHWAMYADSHQGIAVAYDGRHPQMVGFAQTKWFFPVEYVDQRHTVNLSYFDQWDDAKMIGTLRHWLALKARRAWEHEKEWRLAITIRGVPERSFVERDLGHGRIAYFLRLWQPDAPEREKSEHAMVVSAVYLGARSSTELKRDILNAVAAPHLRHVHVYQMEVDPTRYELVPGLVRQGI